MKKYSHKIKHSQLKAHAYKSKQAYFDEIRAYHGMNRACVSVIGDKRLLARAADGMLLIEFIKTDLFAHISKKVLPESVQLSLVEEYAARVREVNKQYWPCDIPKADELNTVLFNEYFQVTGDFMKTVTLKYTN